MGVMKIDRVGVEGLNPDFLSPGDSRRFVQLFDAKNPVTAKQFMLIVRRYL